MKEHEMHGTDYAYLCQQLYDTGLVEFNKVPLQYEKYRGNKEWRPFFNDVANAVIKAVESWKIKKDLSPETVKTFEDIIDEL